MSSRRSFAHKTTPLSEPNDTFVTWVDNYSRIFHHSVVRVSKKDYIQMQWMVEARIITQADIDCSVKTDRSGLIIPIMPPDLFDNTAMEATYTRLRDTPADFLFEKSFCERWDIDVTPPRLKYERLSSRLRERAKECSGFMKKFHPVAVLNINISSNVGLARYLRQVQDRATANPGRTRYHIFVADVNVFERSLKVSVCLWREMCGGGTLDHLFCVVVVVL